MVLSDRGGTTAGPPAAGDGVSVPRQLPGLEHDNHAFWTGGAEGRLLIARCESCSTWIHPPLPRCACCGSMSVSSQPVSGRGRVAAFTVNAQRWVPGLPVPYVFAAVELDEQPRLYVFTNIVGCPVATVETGMPVKVAFEQREDVFLPLFVPDGRDE